MTKLAPRQSCGDSKMARRQLKRTGDPSRSLNQDTVGLGERQHSCGFDSVHDKREADLLSRGKKLREQETDFVLAHDLGSACIVHLPLCR
jgi:hypothetical protein